MPVANFSSLDVCLNVPMNFTDMSTVTTGSLTGWSWNFDDSSPLNTNQSPSHTYGNAGTYNVVFIATTNNGCSDTMTKNVVVHPLPSVQFTLSNVCDGTIVPFNDQSTIPSTDAIQLWRWNFGDGSLQDLNQNTTHLYGAPGTYNVKHIVTSAFGCSDSLTLPVVIYPNPVVKFTTPDTVGCEPLCVTFQNTSTILTGSNVQYLWDLGDSSPTTSAQNPTHCYVNDSVFAPVKASVKLTVTSDKGCVTTLIKNNYIKVFPNPVAAFSVDPLSTTIINPVFTIVDSSKGTNFWRWDFGDKDTSHLPVPTPHTYADTGKYTIMLIASTLFNCKDTAYEQITIEPDFVFYIPNAFSPNGDGVNDFFTGKGIFIEKYEMRIFDRWGNFIFKTTDLNQPWDGRANDGIDIAQQDVYVYQIVVTDIYRKQHNYSGKVTLVR